MPPPQKKAGQNAEGLPDPERLLALSSDMLGVMGFDGLLRTVNPAWQCTLGRAPGELLGRPLLDLVHPEDRENVQETLRKLSSVEGGETCLVNRCLCRDGKLKWLLWRLTASPAMGLYYLAASDITPQKALHVKLLRLQMDSQIGRILAGVAHDFNNILSVIGGCAVMMAADREMSAQQARDLEDITNAAQRGAELVRVMIDLCRPEGAGERRDSDLNEVVLRMERLLRLLLRKNIRLSVSLAEGLGRVRLDSGRLDQILLNLVVNARDAMPDGGSITLKTLPAEAGARLVVRDTGVGIPPDVQARMFEPFFTTKPRGKGTGLGLSTIQEILAHCGGKISVSSRPGEGATLELFLPRADAR
ncbi:MAG: hypothetical protein A2X37_11825 [Elusimicrobia bacterium GWA2_66_18]|nr:MAG: hypothetical protein A2X37_11825 [Elusimicrobia bacterium GWA2_66_18]